MYGQQMNESDHHPLCPLCFSFSSGPSALLTPIGPQHLLKLFFLPALPRPLRHHNCEITDCLKIFAESAFASELQYHCQILAPALPSGCCHFVTSDPSHILSGCACCARPVESPHLWMGGEGGGGHVFHGSLRSLVGPVTRLVEGNSRVG